ncbi:MAG: hypothetical protein E7286_05195 [Lachnospiraceae bacterium]|nr:hypothetical protein [Lachnospiraceae bacterium]
MEDVTIKDMTMKELWSKVRIRVQSEHNLCDALRNSLKGQDEVLAVILEQARKACEGQLKLPGTGQNTIFVGKPPKWSENRTNNDEYICSINRMGHWTDCVTAYALTGEKTYVDLIISEMKDWIATCPSPKLEGTWEEICEMFKIAMPWRTLEIGIRMFEHWRTAFIFLVQEGFMDQELFELFVSSVKEHAYLLKTVPPHLWPDADHNHYLMENLGLLSAGEMLQELPEAAEWIAHAQRELERCAKGQLSEDGGQVEGCPSYHNGCMNHFCIWIGLAKKCNIEIPKEFLDLVYRGLDYSVHSLRPTGVEVPWGDSSPNYGAVSVAIRAYKALGSMRWLNGLGKMIPREKLESLCAAHSHLLEGMTPAELLDKSTPETEEFPLVSRQRFLQQALMRSDWSRQALGVFFACRVPFQNGHTHLDPASFEFTAYGRNLLVDPGIYTYNDDEMRILFKSAKMHNTLTIGGREPVQYTGTWTFEGERDGCMLDWAEAERFLAATSLHTSYFPANHERTVAIVDKKFLLVWDRLTHMMTEDAVEIWYHMNTLNGEILEDGKVRMTEDVSMLIASTANLTPELYPGQISEVFSVSRPSTRVCLSDAAGSGRTRNYCSVIYPYTENAPKISEIVLEEGGNAVRFAIDGMEYHCTWKDDVFSVK